MQPQHAPMPHSSPVPTPDPGPPPGSGRLSLKLALAVAGAGLACAVVIWTIAGNRYRDAVEKLQRAPVGCETTFDFTGSGTFVLYIESKGQVPDLEGDCEASNQTYNRREGGRPRLRLTMTDAGGEPLELERTDVRGYDAGGYEGLSYREVTVQSPGTYVLTVDSEDSDFAVAIGRTPHQDAQSLRSIGMTVAGLGLLAGLLTLLPSWLRRRRNTTGKQLPVPPPPPVVQEAQEFDWNRMYTPATSPGYQQAPGPTPPAPHPSTPTHPQPGPPMPVPPSQQAPWPPIPAPRPAPSWAPPSPHDKRG